MNAKLNLTILLLLIPFTTLSGQDGTYINSENPIQSKIEWKWDLKSSFYVEKFHNIPAPDNEFNAKSLNFLKLYNNYKINPNIKIEIRLYEEMTSISGNIKDKEIDYQNIKFPFFRRFKLSQTQFERENLDLKGEIDLLNLRIFYKQINAVIGRQIISWRHTFFWNPTNWLGSIECGTVNNKNKLFCSGGFCTILDNATENYFDPNQLGRDEKCSVDAVRINTNYLTFDGPEIISAFGNKNTRYEYIEIIRNRLNWKNLDIDMFFGNMKKENRIGLGLNSMLENIEIMSDISLFAPRNDDSFVLASIGGAYKLSNTAKFNIEFYYNGFGVKDTEKYNEKINDERIITGEINNIARYYAGLKYKNEYLLSWKAELSFIYNIVDKSNLFTPQITYSISDDVQFKVGTLFATGKDSENNKILSEFGTYPDNYYIQYEFSF